MTPPEMPDLFPETRDPALGPGASLLGGFAEARAAELLAAAEQIAVGAPFRQMTTPGGWRMSVAMTNCGTAGWLTDRTGYRYDRVDPETGAAWPPMPAVFAGIATAAAAAAGFAGFIPDACLLNSYVPGSRLSLHQDLDEADHSAPIVSVSLGLTATFLFGGLRRADRPRRIPLRHGDVVVWGGPSRLAFHGVAPLAEGLHPLLGRRRLNLTFRRAL